MKTQWNKIRFFIIISTENAINKNESLINTVKTDFLIFFFAQLVIIL